MNANRIRRALTAELFSEHNIENRKRGQDARRPSFKGEANQRQSEMR